jgi:hypothetical protein
MGRDDRLYEEAAALWRALYGEPPPIKADGSTMLDVIVSRGLPEVGYDRLRTPHLRSTNITMPGNA